MRILHLEEWYSISLMALSNALPPFFVRRYKRTDGDDVGGSDDFADLYNASEVFVVAGVDRHVRFRAKVGAQSASNLIPVELN